MSDARPLDSPSDPLRPGDDGADSQIEELLLGGLDHYFSARYEQAIQVWTRVLFLDRGHARARAYIERARGALSERLRESEELLHYGRDAFQRGDASAARKLLTSAVDRGAPADEALALLDRLDRLETAALPVAGSVPARRVRRRPARAAPPSDTPTSSPWVVVVLAVLLSLAGVGAVIATFGDDMGRWLLFEEAERAAVPAAAGESPLPVPSASETALVRARALAKRGRLGEEATPTSVDAALLRDALRALEAVRVGDALWAEANTLRAEIQRALLSAVGGSAAVSGSRTGDPQ
jgi:hypothetical protein